MRKVFIFILALAIMTCYACASDKTKNKQIRVGDMTGEFEIIEAKVIKVYAVDDNGAKFRSYVINWNNNEVVVSDPLAKTDKKEGDLIPVMVQHIGNTQYGGKVNTLSFMITEAKIPEKK